MTDQSLYPVQSEARRRFGARPPSGEPRNNAAS